MHTIRRWLHAAAVLGLAAGVCNGMNGAETKGAAFLRRQLRSPACHQLAELLFRFREQRIRNPTRNASFDAKMKTWNLPEGCWEADRRAGFLQAAKLLLELSAAVGQSASPAATRREIRSDLLCLLEAFPFLQYQAYYGDPSAGPAGENRVGGVPNDFFVQFMSRWVLLILANTMEAEPSPAEWQRVQRSVFPNTDNGRAAFRILRDHRVFLLGIELEPPRSRLAGTTDWFQEEQLAVLERFFSLLPKHLIWGRRPPRVLSITAHCDPYVLQFEAYARQFFPEHADPRAGLGHLSGNSLNIFGAPWGSPKTDVAMVFLRKGNGEYQLAVGRRASPYLVMFAHEMVHHLHATAAVEWPLLERRLEKLRQLGADERLCIRDVDQPPESFGGSGKPGWQWLGESPVEFLATGANVLFVDPEAVFDWAAAMAERHGKLLPLNYLLCFLDLMSLKPDFAPGREAMLFSLQPNGSAFSRIRVALSRDGKGRIVTARWPQASLAVRYRKDDWATLVHYHRAGRLALPIVLVDGVHGLGEPPYAGYLPGLDFIRCEGRFSADILRTADVVFLGYDGAPISDDDGLVLRRFVAEGGGLFIQALGWYLQQYKGISPSDNPLNRLCQPFGLWFNADYAAGETPVTDDRLPWGKGFSYSLKDKAFSANLPHVKQIYTWGIPGSLTISGAAFPIVPCRPQGEGQAIIAGSTYEKGRIVAMQPSGFHDASLCRADALADNAAFVADIFAWLRGQKPETP